MRSIKPPGHPFLRNGLPRRSFTTLAAFVARCGGAGARVREEGAFCKVRTADLRQSYNLPADVLDVIDPDWRVCVAASEKHDAALMSAHAAATVVGIAGGKLYDGPTFTKALAKLERGMEQLARPAPKPSRAEQLSAAARKAWATRRANAVPF